MTGNGQRTQPDLALLPNLQFSSMTSGLRTGGSGEG